MEYPYSLPEDFTEECCPNCGEIVEFTEEHRQQFAQDGHHMEFACPHCDKWICWICQYVY